MRTFIVEVWSRIFMFLHWISLFQLIVFFIRPLRGNYLFVDAWVLGNVLLSFLLLWFFSAKDLAWWEIIVVCYAGLRVFEVFIYQINVVLFNEYRAKKAGQPHFLRGFRRIVVLLLHNYVEIIVWFALLYRNVGWAFETGGVSLDSFFTSLYFSFVTMTTFGYTSFSPTQTVGYILVFCQSIIGLAMILLLFSRFISLLPGPETLDESEK